MSVESLVSIALGLALAAAAGFRVFVPLLVVGLSARADLIALSPDFAWMGSTPALIVFATATILEIAAYYLPLVDNALDTLATPAAVVAGALASAAVITDLPPWLHYSIALILAGGTAGALQASTTLARLGSSALTGGLGNAAVATLELAGASTLAIVAVLFPIAALILVALLLGALLRGVRHVARPRPQRS